VSERSPHHTRMVKDFVGGGGEGGKFTRKWGGNNCLKVVIKSQEPGGAPKKEDD